MSKRTIATYLATTLSFAALGCDDGGSSTGDPGDTGDTGNTSNAAPNVIDDMEDSDRGGAILESAGRIGAWYTFNDLTTDGVQTPPAGAFEPDTLEVPRDGSTYAARSTGEGFTEWGAGFGFDLNNDAEKAGKLPYDASAYKGVTFWALTSEGNTPNVHLTLNDVSTSPEGGVCPVDETDGCNDHFGAQLVLEPGVWKEFTFLFSELTQEGWGEPADAFSPNAIYAIQFTVDAGEKFDVWIDDIAFLVE